MVGEPDGTRLRRATVTGDAADAGPLGAALAERLA
jgi:hypothetical protein